MSGLPPISGATADIAAPPLSADIVAKVTAGNLENRNAQQSNRDEWIFESALRMRARL
jgi:hypothetical protein